VGAEPVWLLNLALVAAAAVLYEGPVKPLGPLARPHLAWWLIALLFALAELCVVHLHFRSGALSFSLGEIPLVFGLVFCGADGVIVACLLGSALVLSLGRRLPAVKLVFNLAQFTLSTSIAVLVVHAIATSGSPSSPRTWLAVLVATECADLITVLLIACAIGLSERQLPLRMLGRMLLTDGAVTLNNASLGLCGVVMVAIDPRALPLLVLPLGTLFVAYRAYLSEFERQKQLHFVHEAGRTLSSAGEVAGVLETLLESSLQAFRAESVELILFGQGEEGPQRMALGPETRREALQPLDAQVAARMRSIVGELNAARMLALGDDGGIAEALGHRPIRQAIIAPLRGEEHLIGSILVVNRLGVSTSFDSDDLMLLDTLAANASVALQYDRLEAAVQRLTHAQDELHHAASHDSLTGLLNRAGFTEQVGEALSEDPLAIALLFVDLDNFKAVNDTLGHATGDDVLITVASRLRACVRGGDIVARLGGDEFAIMVRAPGIVHAAAESVAARIISTCKIELAKDRASVTVHASVGLAVCSSLETSGEELIHAADVAMYRAKTAGKGRYELFGAETP
jgi:diguanylate cyclase (GGDEF)-like protein